MSLGATGAWRLAIAVQCAALLATGCGGGQGAPGGAASMSRAAAADRDSDGVPDVSDFCPGVAEDPDGFEDGDGCPDSDNDADRIADADDECPLEPERYNGTDDEDGCPDGDESAISPVLPDAGPNVHVFHDEIVKTERLRPEAKSPPHEE